MDVGNALLQGDGVGMLPFSACPLAPASSCRAGSRFCQYPQYQCEYCLGGLGQAALNRTTH